MHKMLLALFLTFLCLLVPLRQVYGFEMRGFADIDYEWSPSDKASESLQNGAFAVGQLDLFSSHSLTNHLDALMEVVIEASGGETEIDPERIEIGYSFGDWLDLRLGRFHLPMGYYNNMFHHGRILDATIHRPLIIEFEDEGGIIPGHGVGLWARGSIQDTPAVIKYSIGLVNGQKINTDKKELEINIGADDNKNKAIFANLAVELENGFGFGTSAYSAKVNGYSVAGGTTAVIDANQLIAGFNIYYDVLPLNIMFELYSMLDKDVLVSPSIDYTAAGYFIQAAYEFGQKYRPYIRYDNITPQSNDPYIGSISGTDDTFAFTYGLRYNIAAESCIKAESISKTKGNDSITTFGLQWAYTF